jgi:hypothetical protein
MNLARAICMLSAAILGCFGVVLHGASMLPAFQAPSQPLPIEKTIDYATDIQPILAGCRGCHGAEKREGGLRLDRAGELMRGGDSGLAIEVGKPSASRLIRAVRGQDSTVSPMPPEGPRLSL